MMADLYSHSDFQIFQHDKRPKTNPLIYPNPVFSLHLTTLYRYQVRQCSSGLSGSLVNLE